MPAPATPLQPHHLQLTGRQAGEALSGWFHFLVSRDFSDGFGLG